MKQSTAVSPAMTSTIRFRPGHEQVFRALEALDIEDLHVEVLSGRLYLRGLAACYKTKQLAAKRVAEVMPGTAVVNELRIAQGVSSDADVTRAVETAIRRAVPGARDISAHVNSGDAYVGGIAKDESERCAIEAAVWQAPGVMQVHNQVTVPHRPQADGDVAEGLTKYIQRSVTLPHGAISVRYNRGIVSLDGEVATAQQREAVEDLIRWHDTVTDVVNNVRVAILRTVR